MKITMLGSLGNVNRIVVPRLVADGHDVTVVTSNQDRAKAIKALGATPAVGTMTDGGFLTDTFAGSDVVYLMVSVSNPDLFDAAKKQGVLFAKAVSDAHVTKVVNLSSIGAQDERSGTLYAYHFIEDALSALTDVDVTFIRPTGFYNNLYGNLAALKATHTITSNVPADTLRKYVDPADIADVVYDSLSVTPQGKTIRYVVSDTFTGDQMVAAFSKVLGFDVQFKLISDDDYANSLRQNGVPESIVVPFVKSTQFQRQPEQLYAEMAAHSVHTGHVRLADFAIKFAEAFNAGDDAPKARTVVN